MIDTTGCEIANVITHLYTVTCPKKIEMMVALLAASCTNKGGQK